METTESGQLLLDRRREGVWSGLLLALFVLLRAERYAAPMRELYSFGADGDREAFPVCWKALRQPYHIVATAPASVHTPPLPSPPRQSGGDVAFGGVGAGGLQDTAGASAGCGCAGRRVVRLHNGAA